MTLAELLATLPPTPLDDLALPRRLLGAFRRKSITFCNGMTDERTTVYWFQSRTFTIDLRLPDGQFTPVAERQGWVGDTLWDQLAHKMSWIIESSYQPHNQWPEPASLSFIGNCVLEFAPSGAYVEDWRQQSVRGPMLGLRLTSMTSTATGNTVPMDGGLIIAGEHCAYAQSRTPARERAFRDIPSLENALAQSLITESAIESFEVSVATGSNLITHTTRPNRLGQEIAPADFAIEPDTTVLMRACVDGEEYVLRFVVDLHVPDFTFDRETPASPEAREWMAREESHLAKHSAISL